MIDKKWILKGKEVVEVDLMTWAAWFENHNNRRIGSDETEFYWISTVFLGSDHQFGIGPPLIFETMSFEKKDIKDEDIPERVRRMHDRYGDTDRYSTYDEAVEGHRRMLKRYRREEAAAKRQS